MRTNVGRALLILTVFSIGCGQRTSPPIAATSDTNTEASPDPKHVVNPDAVTEPTRFESIPVQSAELTGVWYGVTRETGVVIQFIGRQSREPDTRGVLSGKWVVHVDRGSIGSAIEFVDNPQSGAVDLEVAMFHNETNVNFTASLGRIQRSSDGSLYLSIAENTATDMYVPVKHIRLQRVTDAIEINPATIEQMRAARETLQAAYQKDPAELPSAVSHMASQPRQPSDLGRSSPTIPKGAITFLKCYSRPMTDFISPT